MPESKTDDSFVPLSHIARETGISYPTLQKYVRDHADRLRITGEGRKRRYHLDCIDVFNELRAASRPGRKPKPRAMQKNLDGTEEPARVPGDQKKSRKRRKKAAAKPIYIEDRIANLERDIAKINKILSRPIRVKVTEAIAVRPQ